jgi:LmbE family N-acetylglucosaminyl deacetylase
MGIAAHQDDLEIMAFPGVLHCVGSNSEWFLGMVVTDGAGSPRSDLYADYTDDQMREVRKLEQKKAAVVGEYGAQVFLDYPSSAVKDRENHDIVADIKQVLLAANPTVVYTHNLADKHDTHVAVGLRAIAAIRELPRDKRPTAVYGCEIWRDLDWLTDDDKIVFDVQARENLAEALLGVFDSQIRGGKRYDLATIGRRRAHATFSAPRGADTSTGLIFAMDLTPLVVDPTMEIAAYVNGYMRRFQDDVLTRISRFA